MATQTTQAVRVGVLDLIKAIEAKRDAWKLEYDSQLAKYAKALPAWRKKVIAELEAKAIELRALSIDPEDLDESTWANRTSFSVSVQGSPPMKPSEPSLIAIERDLNLLRISAEGEILVRTDSQWSKYL
jgi:hypothetical protein